MAEEKRITGITPRSPHERRFAFRGNAHGFSLIELIVALGISLVLLGAAYSIFSVQNKHLVNQEQLAEMQQNARMAMDMIVKDIRMAGYNPTGSLPKCVGTLPNTVNNAPCVGMLNANSNVIQFNMDTRDSGAGAPDGDTDDPNETITYGLYTTNSIQNLGRKTTTSGSYQPVVENIDSLTFSYLNTSAGTANNIGSIREIVVTLVAKTSKSDPSYTANSGYRTYTLTARVTPRNLDY